MGALLSVIPVLVDRSRCRTDGVPEAFSLQTAHPNMFSSVPGYGALGAKQKDVAEIYGRGRCAVVNNSRGIITAHKGKAEDASFVDRFLR